MNKKMFLITLLAFLSSCGGVSTKAGKASLVNGEDRFSYTDKNGQYIVRTSSGFDKQGKSFFTKRTMEMSGQDKDKVLEQSVALSTIGVMAKKLTVLRPKLSQYNVWFEGKKYSTELKLNPGKKAIDVKMTSPESQWNGTKQVKFPSSKILPCFFSQIIECAKVSGFIKKASDKKTGVMTLMVIWEGYPYLNETFTDFPTDLFSQAQLSYDGMTKESERRFNLRVAGQSIFYVLDNKDVMKKMFWVSQGISMVSKTAKASSPEDGGDIE